VATGMDTELGHIAGLLDQSPTEVTPLQRRLGELGRVLIVVCLAIVAVIFTLEIRRGGSLSEVLMTSVSLAVAVGISLLLVRRPPTLVLPALALGFLLGGAVGNGLDRWRLGAVIDFLEFVPVPFPVFNIADVAINLAVLCFALDALAGLRREDSRDA
jgi:hypothetical protein